MEKHYDSDYLKNSGRVLKTIKEYSYSFIKKDIEGNIIDLGCGNGIDVHTMAKSYSNTKIIGIDHDTTLIDIAKKNTTASNVSFIHSEAHDIPFDSNSINGLRAERIIQHLSNPEDVLKEVYRVLKENSPFVIVETDWHGITFYTEHINIENKIKKYLVEDKIKNGLASRNTLNYLNNQKFKNINVKVFPITLYSLNEANGLFKIEELINEMENKSLLTKDETNKFSNSLHELDKSNCFYCSIDLIVFASTK